MKFICFTTTTDDKNIAENICFNMISKGYSPCASYKTIKSNYKWNEKIICNNEYQIEIKTINAYSDDVVKLITKLNNYEIPQIISNNITLHNKEYKNWYLECLNQ
tara:strand:+ start:406 stop:720 length:315 start_codon:yes stop_codon:yes gene_type:complete